MSELLIVSACLLGLRTRYDGQSKVDSTILEFFRQRKVVPLPVCPEQLAGLPTPRLRTFFTCGDANAVIEGKGGLCNENGERMNELFLRGAQQTLEIAQMTGCRRALFKERSPSCGVRSVYMGEKKVPGCGVTTALFAENDIAVFSEEELGELIIQLTK
jgi:uncharacterized protein YbbK (DUF523 family)